MNRLDPIPSPLVGRIREFRYRVLPVLAFLAAIVGVATLWP
jgi:hypothetical protein